MVESSLKFDDSWSRPLADLVLHQKSNITKAGLHCGSMWAKQMGGKLFQGVQALGKSGLCSRQFSGGCFKVVPQSTAHLNGGRPCGAMTMAKSCKDNWSYVAKWTQLMITSSCF